MEEIIRNAKKNMYTDTYTYFRDDVFHALVGLNPWKASDGPDGVPPIVLRNCASVLAPCLVKLFQPCLFIAPIVIGGTQRRRKGDSISRRITS